MYRLYEIDPRTDTVTWRPVTDAWVRNETHGRTGETRTLTGWPDNVIEEHAADYDSAVWLGKRYTGSSGDSDVIHHD